MSEMIERAAKAICEAHGLKWEDQASFETSANGDDNEQDFYRIAARAAIESLREVTPEMFDAGATVLFGVPREKAEEYAKLDKFENWGETAKVVFQAMIAAALSSEKE